MRLRTTLYKGIGRLASAVGCYRAAARYLGRAARRDDADAALWCRLGECHERLGDLRAARDAYERAFDAGQDWSVKRKIESVTQRLAQCRPAKPSAQEVEELFLARVPPELRALKTGMNVCLFADYNTAQWLTLLRKALNRYTIHKARSVVVHPTYLSYEDDVVLEGPGADPELARKVVEGADFYHIVQRAEDFGDVHFRDLLRPDNCVFQYLGSQLRRNAEQVAELHRRTRFAALTAWDWTLASLLPSFYHIDKILDVDSLPQAEPHRPGQPVRIAHAPTKRQAKGTDVFLRVADTLARHYPLEVDLIERVPYAECIRRKARCHMTFDQLYIGETGTNTIESMAMGHVAFCALSNFFMSLHPDNPIVNVTEATLSDRIEQFLRHPERIPEVGRAGRQWVEAHHAPRTVVKRYAYIYDLVHNGGRNVADPRELFLDVPAL